MPGATLIASRWRVGGRSSALVAASALLQDLCATGEPPTAAGTCLLRAHSHPMLLLLALHHTTGPGCQATSFVPNTSCDIV
jgi:hypothetical protein